MKGLPHGVADALQSATYSQRALAYLQVDAELTLVGAGGNLENYGLAAVQLGQSALDQAFFLEGLLPLVDTPSFIPSVELNGGSVADLHFYLDGECVWVVLLDVTLERDQARRVLQKAYEMTPKKDEWVFLSELGQTLLKIDPQFKTKTYGQKGLSQLVTQYVDLFELRTEKGKGKILQMYVKLKI